MKYEKLFSRGKIGRVTLKNRVVLPAMGSQMVGVSCEANEAVIGYFEARAKGGVGLIITGVTRVCDETGVTMQGQLSLADNKYIRSMRRLTDAVHQYDTKIFVQLQHPGRSSHRKIMNGVQPVAPSAIPSMPGAEPPHELTIAECENLVRKFGTAAHRARLAGFDGVEIHGAHSYLINQFLSPITNHRTDKYGGSPEKRMTFLLEIVQSVRAAVGPDFPISVRLSCDEFLEGGNHLPEFVQISKALEAHGVDAINVSAGSFGTGYATSEPYFLPEGWKKHLATEIKKNVSIPVIAVNHILTAATAEQFLQEGVSDFVGVGRGHVADPEWVNKARQGRECELHKCLSCIHCFASEINHRSLECTINPLVGREYRFNEDTMKRNGAGKTIAVIGGGPAGMEAAYVCAQRGYRVVLFEQADRLGGTACLAALPPHKEAVADFIATQEGELKRTGVEVHLNTPATTELVASLNPHAIFVATGAKAVIPSLPGVDLPHVCTARDVLTGKVSLTGKRVVVIGGGVTGLETAQIMAGQGNTVTVLEATRSVGGELYYTVNAMLQKELHEAGVTVLTGRKVNEITENALSVTNLTDGTSALMEADAVVLSLGVVSDDTVPELFEAAFDNVIRIGDAEQAGDIAAALRSAHDKAFVI